MKNEAQAKILQLLDVVSVEVAANRNDVAGLRGETAELRNEMRAGFSRVERGRGNLEIRVERVEIERRDFRSEFERRIAPLEHDYGINDTIAWL